MTIAELLEKSKGLLAKIPRDLLVFSVLFGASALSFGLGFQAGKEAGVHGSVNLPESAQKAAAAVQAAGAGKYVASKNGIKYYLPTCAGAERISEANKIWFATAEEARAAGYSPAANCNGI